MDDQTLDKFEGELAQLIHRYLGKLDEERISEALEEYSNIVGGGASAGSPIVRVASKNPVRLEITYTTVDSLERDLPDLVAFGALDIAAAESLPTFTDVTVHLGAKHVSDTHEVYGRVVQRMSDRICLHLEVPDDIGQRLESWRQKMRQADGASQTSDEPDTEPVPDTEAAHKSAAYMPPADTSLGFDRSSTASRSRPPSRPTTATTSATQPTRREPQPVGSQEKTPSLDERIETMAARLDRDAHFEFLGLDWAASEWEIERRHRELRLQFALSNLPLGIDRDQRLAVRKINARLKEAYEILGDPRRRRKYRQELISEEQRRAKLEEIEARARQAVVQRDYKSALDDYQRVLELEPEHEKATQELPELIARTYSV